MNDAERASEGAWALHRLRWGDQVLRRAVSTVVERRDQLDDELRDDLRAVVSQDGDNT